MKVEVKYMRFEHRFGRLVAMAQLFDQQMKLLHADAPLSLILSLVKTNNYELVNSQDILFSLVVQGGFAS